MSLPALEWAWCLEVPPTHKLVALALADHANDEGVCWPSLTRLAQRTGLSRSTIAEALKALEAAHIIFRQRGGPKRATHYRLGANGSPGAGLVRQPVVRELDAGSPGAGPGSPAAGLSVVREPDPNRKLNRNEPSVNHTRARERGSDDDPDYTKGATAVDDIPWMH